MQTVFKNEPLKFFLVVCIIVVTISKLSLIGEGLLSFPDEFRYMAAEKVITDLSELNISGACNAIFSTKSKPGDVILSAIPNAFQQFTGYLSNIYCYDSSNSYPLFIFNFIIYCLILIVHYKFSKLVLKNEFLALLSVLVYSTLTNSYMYMRHVLAYDTSLLIFYWFIYRIVCYVEDDTKLSFKKSTLIGVCSFFGYLVYPGYFPLFFLCVFLFFFYNLSKKSFLKRVVHVFYYAIGSIYCLIIFEIMSRIGNSSYIDDALHASSIVKQGSPEESYSFLFKYMYEVEGLSGLLLSLLLLTFCFSLLNLLVKKKFQENQLLVLLGLGVIFLFLGYASVGYFFDNFYLMGRSLHDFYPFICIFSIFSIDILVSLLTQKKELILLCISFIFTINFGTKLVNYLSISYPRDTYWKLGETTNLAEVQTVCEYGNGWSVNPGEKEYFQYLYKHPSTIISTESIIVANGCFYYPVNDMSAYHEFLPDNTYTLIDKRPHYLNFKAYQFEGPNIAERQNIDQLNFQVKIFSKRK